MIIESFSYYEKFKANLYYKLYSYEISITSL